ncbi:MAG: menaquinone biosynthesis decarboxylase [Spirochaetes bacterium]|jgi:4-hydroxy-3-polyprenylbenzoate decarboxylase|nr:menaquinone biosynthesis decarboxylase [Spirochaetota bacterium]
MPYKNLNEFISRLESGGELKRISAEADPRFEITQIADIVSKNGGPALLFEKVKGSNYPLLINAFGSYKRMGLALNCGSFDEIGERMASLLKMQPPSGIMDKIRMLFTLREMAALAPKRVKSAPCQEVVVEASGSSSGPLDLLPVQTCWPQDGGPFITLPLVITRDPESGAQNIGMYRMQKFDGSSTGMHWQYNKDGARHYEKYCKLGKRMDVAVALGGCPAVTYSATAPLPPDVNELLLAGFIEGGPIEVVKAIGSDLLVPAESDFVIEGYVDPGDEKIEGPFGDHTGFYSPADAYPVFRVTRVTSRRDAVYPSTIVGKPPMEDCYMAKATERIFLPFIKLIVPEVKDINLPMEGVFHNCALVSIDKKYSGQAKKVINALWGMGQMSSTKYIAVFDADIDLADYGTVLWKLLNNVDPSRDLVFSRGPLDALDHSASFANYGGKLGMDATRKTREEGMGREWPDEIKMSDDVIEAVKRRWDEYGL